MQNAMSPKAGWRVCPPLFWYISKRGVAGRKMALHALRLGHWRIDHICPVAILASSSRLGSSAFLPSFRHVVATCGRRRGRRSCRSGTRSFRLQQGGLDAERAHLRHRHLGQATPRATSRSPYRRTLPRSTQTGSQGVGGSIADAPEDPGREDATAGRGQGHTDHGGRGRRTLPRSTQTSSQGVGGAIVDAPEDPGREDANGRQRTRAFTPSRTRTRSTPSMGRALTHSHPALVVIVLRHVGHGVPTDSLGLYVTAGIQVFPP